MKTSFYLVIFLVFFGNVANAQSNLNLFDAIKQNKVKATFAGSGKSVHYIRPLVMEIQNLGTVDLPLILPAGSFFVSEPAEYQDILVMQTLAFTLKPSEKRTFDISGNCTEPTHKAPNEKVIYRVATGKKELVEFAKFIDQEKLWEIAETQYATWKICNNGSDVQSLYGYSGNEKGKKIREGLAKVMGIKLELNEKDEVITVKKTYQILIDEKVTQEYTQVKTETYKGFNCEMWGGGMYDYHKPCKMQIGMFNDKGVLIREIYYKEKETAGRHTVKYAYDCDAYQDNVYYFKYIKDGVVVKNIALKKG